MSPEELSHPTVHPMGPPAGALALPYAWPRAGLLPSSSQAEPLAELPLARQESLVRLNKHPASPLPRGTAVPVPGRLPLHVDPRVELDT